MLHNDLIKWEPWDLYTRYGLGPEATTADVYDFRSGNDTRGQAVEPIGWQTVIASVTFAARALTEIKLFPLDLGSRPTNAVSAEGLYWPKAKWPARCCAACNARRRLGRGCEIAATKV